MDLQIWDIRPGNELARTLTTSLQELLANPPPEYVFEFSNQSTNFFANGDGAYFVVGEDVNQLLGYATCVVRQPPLSIGKASRLIGLDNEFTELFDSDGLAVTRTNLGDYEGYSRYTGRKQLLFIQTMDIFLPGRGIDSILLEHIKSRFELIEVEVNGTAQANFLGNHGFVRTGIQMEEKPGLNERNGEDWPIMVWHNSYSLEDTTRP